MVGKEEQVKVFGLLWANIFWTLVSNHAELVHMTYGT